MSYTQNTQTYLCLHVCKPMYVCIYAIILRLLCQQQFWYTP